MDYRTNVRSTGQLREGSVGNVHINESAAIALSKLAEVVIKADGLVPFSGDQSFDNHRITNLGTPVSFTDAANKDYVVQNLKAHKVAAVSTSNITNLESLPVIDGYQTIAEDLILLVGQTDQKNNGIWKVSASSWVRAEILKSGDAAAGTFVFVTDGAQYKNSGFICTSIPSQDIIGSNNITFRQFVTKELGVFYDTLKVYTSGAFSVINSSESDAVTISHDQLQGFIKTVTGNLILMAENGSGFVGINKDNPEYSIDINGDVNFSGALRKNGVDIGNSFVNYEPFYDVFSPAQDQTVFELSGTPPTDTNENWICVVRNGLQLDPSEYQLTKSGEKHIVTLAAGCDFGDILTIRPFGLATVISTVEIPENGMLFVPESLQVGENSVHITDSAIYGNDPNLVNGETFRINVNDGDATFKRDVAANRDANISRNAVIGGNLTIGGDIFVSGAAFSVNAQQVQVTDNIIILNKDEVGGGVTNGIAGIEIERGTGDNYQFMFRESDDTFVIGLPSSLQAVATREDSPISNAITFWDSASLRLKTASGITIEADGKIHSNIVGNVTGNVSGNAGTADVATSANRIRGINCHATTIAPTGTARLNIEAYLYATRVYNAVWNDIAEAMPSDGSLQPGDMAQIDLRSSEYRLTKFRDNFDAFIGIVSENPGFVVGENPDYENPVYVALKGMVYTKALGIHPVGTMLYLTPDGVKTRQEISFKYNHFDVQYIGKVIESHADKIKIYM